MADQRNSSGNGFSPALPINISCLATAKDKRYMLYDIDVIMWLRREHHILGVFIGSLPQAPSQSTFPGLPLMLMPEEVRLLVEKGLARIIDDHAWFSAAAQDGVVESKMIAHRTEVNKQGLEVAEAAKRAREIKAPGIVEILRLKRQTGKKKKSDDDLDTNGLLIEDNLFAGEESAPKAIKIASPSTLQPYATTPADTDALKPQMELLEIPQIAESSYSLFKLLHDRGYFMAPGLRFGCQYMAYPGDKLRYHSHFLAVAVDWNEDLDLIDIIGGGRLATNVKKSYLFGGIQPANSTDENPKTRVFSLEWAGI